MGGVAVVGEGEAREELDEEGLDEVIVERIGIFFFRGRSGVVELVEETESEVDALLGRSKRCSKEFWEVREL